MAQGEKALVAEPDSLSQSLEPTADREKSSTNCPLIFVRMPPPIYK